jgi:predicted glycoside hydrolase/deacetylase ChbG (UPF0249 family)
MEPNPVLKKLGYSVDDRVVIVHADDIGMCQASISAFQELWEFGIISSGAVMVPCSWFPSVAKTFKKNPEVDLGVHVTLTSEWETYRWGPISTRDPSSGLMDDDGYFFKTTEEIQHKGDPESVRKEIKAQIEKALSSGISLTHIDTHMGSVGSLNFIPAYLSLASYYGIPAMLMRLDKGGWIELGFNNETAMLAEQMVQQLEEQGIPLVDAIDGLELDAAETTEERIKHAKQVLGSLNKGITHFIIHPSKDTPELRAITSDWRCRVSDYNAFKSRELRNFIENNGIHVIGYKALKDLLPEGVS